MKTTQVFSPKKMAVARERRNISYFDAAVEFGKLCTEEKERVTDATLRRWEDGETEPRASDLAKLATVYKVQVEEFFS